MKVPKQDNAPLPPMDDTPPIGGGAAPSGEPDDLPPMDDDMPSDDKDEAGPKGDGTEDGNTSDDQKELDDIFNSASLEDKNAILKYARSQTEQSDDDNADKDKDDEAPMPMESKSTNDDLINEIVNNIIGDMNNRKGIKGVSRGENKITNRRLRRNNPFVADR